jgi:VWFA-related protein
LLTLVAGSSVAIGHQQEVFRAGAHGVSVDVSVRNGNRPVTDLRAGDFVVYDNDQKQTIGSLSTGALPIDVTLFLGTNNQTESQQLAALNRDVKRIGQLLRPEDRVRLLTLRNDVNQVFDWRAAGEFEPIMNVQVGGVQSLYDACFLAMMKTPDPERRRLIVAITDGNEFGSVVDSTTVGEVARRADAVLHVVVVKLQGDATPDRPLPGPGNPAFGTSGPPGMTPVVPVRTAGFGFLRASWFHVLPEDHGLDRLEEAARTTGGTVRNSNPSESIVDSFKRAFEDFRQSYVLRYTAAGVQPEGWHTLRVEVVNGSKYTVRARRGYFGGIPPAAEPSNSILRTSNLLTAGSAQSSTPVRRR